MTIQVKDLPYKIYEAARKIRGMAYLFESKGETQVEPCDYKEANSGIAAILEAISSEITAVGEGVEKLVEEFE